MRREASTPRPGWQQKLEQLGFDYYMLEGKTYRWDPSTNEFSVTDARTGKIISYFDSSIGRDGRPSRPVR